MSARAEILADPLVAARNAFGLHAHSLPRQPTDRELFYVAYAVELALNAPPYELQHHSDLVQTVRTQLAILPEIIAGAEAHTTAARAAGRRVDLDRFVENASALLTAAEAFRPITARPDARRYWHDGGRLLARAIDDVFRVCGGSASFSHEDSEAVMILGKLLNRNPSQVFNSMYKWSRENLG